MEGVGGLLPLPSLSQTIQNNNVRRSLLLLLLGVVFFRKLIEKMSKTMRNTKTTIFLLVVDNIIF